MNFDFDLRFVLLFRLIFLLVSQNLNDWIKICVKYFITTRIGGRGVKFVLKLSFLISDFDEQ